MKQRLPNVKVVLVAIPLMARSGVYRSAHDLVNAARESGLCWSAVLGVRPDASGEAVASPGVREISFSAHGPDSIGKIRDIIDSAPEVQSADVIITLISQSDMAATHSIECSQKLWVAWVRGKPWPDRREQAIYRRVPLRLLETLALRKADEVWATTSVLAREFSSARTARIVPAGIAAVRRRYWGTDEDAPLVWAGRIDVDKRLELFIEIIRRTGREARVFGEGPLAAELARDSPKNVDWVGWASSEELWETASLFVGTSYREAFGRSATEAAMVGLPIVIGQNYGAAPLLVTDAELRRHCLIEEDLPEVWASAVERILSDADLRRRISDHVHENASRLTIEASVKAVQQRIEELSG